jgi:hypothetical protein
MGDRCRTLFRRYVQHHQIRPAWLEDASKRPVTDPSRLAQILAGFADRFGNG